MILIIQFTCENSTWLWYFKILRSWSEIRFETCIQLAKWFRLGWKLQSRFIFLDLTSKEPMFSIPRKGEHYVQFIVSYSPVSFLHSVLSIRVSSHSQHQSRLSTTRKTLLLPFTVIYTCQYFVAAGLVMVFLFYAHDCKFCKTCGSGFGFGLVWFVIGGFGNGKRMRNL